MPQRPQRLGQPRPQAAGLFDSLNLDATSEVLARHPAASQAILRQVNHATRESIQTLPHLAVHQADLRRALEAVYAPPRPPAHARLPPRAAQIWLGRPPASWRANLAPLGLSRALPVDNQALFDAMVCTAQRPATAAALTEIWLRDPRATRSLLRRRPAGPSWLEAAALAHSAPALAQLTELRLLSRQLQDLPGEGIARYAPHLRRLVIDAVLKSWPQTYALADLGRLEDLDISNLPDALRQLGRLRALHISGFGHITRLPAAAIHLIRSYELSIASCTSLLRLPNPLSHFAHLRQLSLEDLPELLDIPAADDLPAACELRMLGDIGTHWHDDYLGALVGNHPWSPVSRRSTA